MPNLLNPSRRGVEREHAGGADGAGDEGEDDVRGADDVEGAAPLNHASVIEDLQEDLQDLIERAMELST